MHFKSYLNVTARRELVSQGRYFQQKTVTVGSRRAVGMLNPMRDKHTPRHEPRRRTGDICDQSLPKGLLSTSSLLRIIVELESRKVGLINAKTKKCKNGVHYDYVPMRGLYGAKYETGTEEKSTSIQDIPGIF